MNSDPTKDTAEHHHDTEPAVPVASEPRPPIEAVTVDWAALSHPGLVRPSNEDYFLLARAGRFLRTVATNLPEGYVPEEFGEAIHAVVVADGMGGETGGDVASREAIAVLLQLVLSTPDWVMGLGEAEVAEVLDRTVQRFRTVNESVVELGRELHLTRMGTTLTAVWNLGTELFVVHVGDARVYLLHGGGLRKLTRDHTMAQALADTGHISPEEVTTHRLRNVLTRVIGRHGKGEPEVYRAKLADGDRVLVCTDGLTDMVDEGAIAAELGRGAPAAETCQRLLDAALRAGGKDNVTVAVAGYRIPRLP
jgi:protein phosphatase